MAGIGFELRKLTQQGSIISVISANIYAAVLSSGAWVISISILAAIYWTLHRIYGYTEYSIQFLVTITYLIAGSLLLSSFFQNGVNRFIANKMYEEHLAEIPKALLSSSIALIAMSSVVAIIAIMIFLPHEPFMIQLLVANSFIVLNLVWLFSSSLTGLKNYQFIVVSFIASYSLIFALALWLFNYGLAGLLFSFYVGHLLLLALFCIFTLANFPTKQLYSLEIFEFIYQHRPLVYGGMLFQLGVWIDKFVFWGLGEASIPIIGRLYASPVYDMPMFIAFIFMTPGLAVFFYEIEANFSRFYDYYYDALTNGATLAEIDEKHLQLVSFARSSLLTVMKVQAILMVITCLLSKEIMHLFGLPVIYEYLFRVDMLAASLLVYLIGQVNLLYYLSRSHEVVRVAGVFVLSNLVFSCFSLYLGPLYYGYGFALSILLANVMAVMKLSTAIQDLTYYSFMSIQGDY